MSPPVVWYMLCLSVCLVDYVCTNDTHICGQKLHIIYCGAYMLRQLDKYLLMKF